MFGFVRFEPEFVLGFSQAGDQGSGGYDGRIVERNFDDDGWTQKVQEGSLRTDAARAFERHRVQGELRSIVERAAWRGGSFDVIGFVIDDVEFPALFEPEIDCAAKNGV